MSVSSRPLKVLLHPASKFAGDLYRISGPAAALVEAGLATVKIERRYLARDELTRLNPDVVVVQHQYTDPQLVDLRNYHDWMPGLTILYELDDLLWDLPHTNPHRESLPQDIKRRIRDALKVCSGVVVSTDELAQAVQKDFGYVVRNKPVRVCRNVVTSGFLAACEEGRRTARHTRRPNELPRVGWAGNISHAADIAFLADIVRQTCTELHWVFMGMAPAGVQHLVEFHPLVGLDTYPDALARLDLDLAVAPFSDTPFDRCKSDLRILELGAAGFPVLTNRSFPCAITADKSQWADMIPTLVGDPEDAVERASDLLNHITAHCSFRDPARALEWREAWSPVGPAPAFVPARPPRLYEEVVVSTPDDLKAAWAEKPGRTIVYLRPGTQVSETSFSQARLLIQRAASLTGFTNDGDYPVIGIHTPMSPQQSADVETSLPSGEPTPIPFPTGPFVLLSGAALTAVGLPDVDRYRDIEMALLDWGCRAAQAGWHHVQASSVWAYTAAPQDRTTVDVARFFQEVQDWYPAVLDALKAFKESRDLPAIRSLTDQTYARITYDAPATRSYEEWARLHNDGGAGWSQPTLSTITRSALFFSVPSGGSLTFGKSENPDVSWVILHRLPSNIAPYAVAALLRAAEENPDAALIYGDHDFVASEGVSGERVHPWFKREFSYEHLLGQDYLGGIILVRRESFDALGVREEFGPAALYDLALRVIARDVLQDGKVLNDRVTRVPLVLSSIPLSAPRSAPQEHRAVLEHLQETGASAAIVPHPDAPGARMIRWLPRASSAVDLVFLVGDDTQKALTSLSALIRVTALQNLRIIVRATPEAWRDLEAKAYVKTVQHRLIWLPDGEELQDPAEFRCIMTDDILVHEPAWLNDLVGLAERPGVVAFPRVLAPDGTLLGLGILQDSEGLEVEALKGQPAEDPGPHGLGLYTADWRAVRHRGCMVRRMDFGAGEDATRLVIVRSSTVRLQGALTGPWDGLTEMTPELLNPNLQAVPTLDLPRTRPDRPWRDVTSRRVLLINSPDHAAEAALRFPDGDLCSAAVLQGSTLHVIFPPMPNVPPVDLRRHGPEGAALLERLGVEAIELQDLGDIGVDALALLGGLKRAGLPVRLNQVQPCSLPAEPLEALWRFIAGSDA